MKKLLFIIIIGIVFNDISANNDSLWNRYLIKTIPLKVIAGHPNLGLEIPITQKYHLDIHGGIFFLKWTDYHIEQPRLKTGLGYSSMLAIKKFRFTGNKDRYYWGTALTYRNFKSSYTTLGCYECSEYGYQIIKSVSLEFWYGYQNEKRTIEPYLRIGGRITNSRRDIREEYIRSNINNKFIFDSKKVDEMRIWPVVTIGFFLSRPIL